MIRSLALTLIIALFICGYAESGHSEVGNVKGVDMISPGKYAVQINFPSGTTTIVASKEAAMRYHAQSIVEVFTYAWGLFPSVEPPASSLARYSAPPPTPAPR